MSQLPKKSDSSGNMSSKADHEPGQSAREPQMRAPQTRMQPRRSTGEAARPRAGSGPRPPVTRRQVYGARPGAYQPPPGPSPARYVAMGLGVAMLLVLVF